MGMLALFSLIRGCSMTGEPIRARTTMPPSSGTADLFKSSSSSSRFRNIGNCMRHASHGGTRGCTRTFGTDHYESISEDENGGPFVGRLICDKIVGGLTTGWKLRKDASRTREVWSRGTNCHGKKKTDERGEGKEGGHGDNETSTVQLGPKCDAVAIVCSRMIRFISRFCSAQIKHRKILHEFIFQRQIFSFFEKLSFIFRYYIDLFELKQYF